MRFMTYSIIARDIDTGEMGVAVQSKFPGAGSLVPFAEAGVGAVATQAFGNYRHGIEGLRQLKSGRSSKETLKGLISEDSNQEERQVAIMDNEGSSECFTGSAVHSWDGWAGSLQKDNFLAHGNSLYSKEVLQAAYQGFMSSSGDLGSKLINGLLSAQDAGGEIRGQQSAALYLVQLGAGFEGYSGIKANISVYDHIEPIIELQRCYGLHALSYYPSDPENLVDLEGRVATEVLTVLKDFGVLDQEAALWKETYVPKLKRLMGTLNYDNRLRDDNKIDLEVLHDLKSKAKLLQNTRK